MDNTTRPTRTALPILPLPPLVTAPLPTSRNEDTSRERLIRILRGILSSTVTGRNFCEVFGYHYHPKHNVFTRVCDSVHRGTCLVKYPPSRQAPPPPGRHPPSRQAPPRQAPPQAGTPPPGRHPPSRQALPPAGRHPPFQAGTPPGIRSTLRPIVRILLECILVVIWSKVTKKLMTLVNSYLDLSR